MIRRDALKVPTTRATPVVMAEGHRFSRQVEAGLVVDRLHLPIRQLPPVLKGLRIVQLSDLHLYPYTRLRFLTHALAVANSLKPDLMVLTGDYVTRRAEPIFELAPVLASLKAKYGVFASLGNHDRWTDVDVVRAGLRQARVPVLCNEGITLNIGGAPLYLAGVDTAWGGCPDLRAALSGHPSGAPVVLLAHEPDQADVFSEDGRVALQLSGHTHGGQVRLPRFGPPILPYMGQKYDQGLYRVNEMWLYTNRGLGLIVPVRLNCPPEVTEITLMAGEVSRVG